MATLHMDIVSKMICIEPVRNLGNWAYLLCLRVKRAKVASSNKLNPLIKHNRYFSRDHSWLDLTKAKRQTQNRERLD